MEDLVARTLAGIDKKRAKEQQRNCLLDEAKVHAVKLAMDTARREADMGKASCRVVFQTNEPLLQTSPDVYCGYDIDISFITSIYSKMTGYRFYRDAATAAIEDGGIVIVRRHANFKGKEIASLDGISISLDWSRCVKDTKAQDKNTKAPPSKSNFDLHCPVCMEDTPANVLVPCGHHVCKVCVGKLHLNDSDVGIHVKNCPVCNSAFHRTQLVFADRKRKHAEI